METISALYPTSLWQQFDKICNIPHPSKHEQNLVNYILDFCKKNGIEAFTDKVGNVIARKPASVGYEQLIPVVLQAHLDMVPQKNSNIKHDFLLDPIIPFIEGDWVRATNTTLGADNGIGVAAILAVLESKNIAHGPIEALFTIDEETGMTGATGLQEKTLNGEILLNLDSEDDTEVIVGCAGGINFEAVYNYTSEPAPKTYRAYQVVIQGLNGGHSGIDIALNRANANLLMVRYLTALTNKNVLVASIEGGNMRNAIPREARAVLLVPVEAKDRVKKFTERFFKLVKQEYKSSENAIEIELKRYDDSLIETIIAPQDIKQILRGLTACPSGVVAMNKTWNNTVETSTNLSIINNNESILKVSCLLRSSDNGKKLLLAQTMCQTFELFGFEAHTSGDYPGWQPSANSKVLDVVQTIYPRVMGEKPHIRVIHAGLECGIIARSYPAMDMVSFGPTICFPHSPDERVSISSVGKFWNLLQEVLKAIPQKNKK